MYIYIYIYIYIWFLFCLVSPLLNPCPRCRKQDESQLYFIFYYKLSKLTPDYVSELINLNYSFNIPLI